MRPRTSVSIIGAALAVAGVIACGGGGDKGSSSPDTGQGGTTSAAGAGKGSAVALGKPARDGKFEFTVSKLDCSKTKVGAAPMTQTAQGKFCLATLAVKNIGKEAQMFDASSQKALDAKGATYDADGEAAIYVNQQAETFLNNINPGNTVTGVVPFDVPKTITVTELELHDSPFSDGVKVKVS